MATIAQAAKSCCSCNLWRWATQTVFGEGIKHAEVMLVGKHPGNQEDIR
jgi:uracil-DNA glycosylase